MSSSSVASYPSSSSSRSSSCLRAPHRNYKTQPRVPRSLTIPNTGLTGWPCNTCDIIIHLANATNANTSLQKRLCCEQHLVPSHCCSPGASVTLLQTHWYESWLVPTHKHNRHTPSVLHLLVQELTPTVKRHTSSEGSSLVKVCVLQLITNISRFQ